MWILCSDSSGVEVFLLEGDLEDMAMREALRDLEQANRNLSNSIDTQNVILKEMWTDMKRVGRKAVIILYFSLLVLVLVGWFIDQNNLLTKVTGL